ncbi:probable glucomannan 4-beta-mannosyltransferase 7 isoform X2 [Triticum urartu]|uniref:probable glucomannan 4-beta-mannosyltransferase 7 isoform X2 n=1 Tax=Triticum urartu TaxID=4572 RepID=UPI002044499A|nr:probable glucomannan 4-beta-mannosyltransferase 7 isoform X2 [Triticum urartu]
MEAGEIGGALLFVLAAAAAVLAAVSTGAVDFSHPPAVGGQLDFQETISWFTGVYNGASYSSGAGAVSLAEVHELWVRVRGRVIAPALQVTVWACMVMSVMLAVEALYNCVVSLGVKAIGWRPEWRFKWEPLAGDEEKGSAHYPMVLVQIPMYNELEVYKLSIGAACELKWPKDRMIVQVLDNSTDPLIKNFAVNGTVSLLTRIQKMFFDYHFKVEQEAGSATFAFFSFNGTAGVWRTAAIKEAGGWKDRTTVEDMDLAIRATLKGWKFIYVGDIRVKSELPSSYKAYCRQQFRWACGGANLFRKVAIDILTSKDVSVVKKFYMLYSFLFVRRVVAPAVACILSNIIVPLSVMIPELYLPVWGVAYIPAVLLVVTAIRNPKNIHLLPFWILFESVMTMHRTRAALVGLFEFSEFNEWVVTKKTGNNFEDNKVPLLQKTRKRLRDRVNFPEILFSAFLFFCASYNLVFPGKTSYYFNLYLQGLAFAFLGLNFTGTCTCFQ